MRALGVVKREIVLQTVVDLIEGVIGVGIDLFIFDRSPQPFNKDIVMRPSSTIHTDLDARLRQTTGEGEAGELRTLIRVKNHRLSGRQGVFQTVQAKTGFQGVRQPPG